MNIHNPVFVLGTFETALGVVRSFGKGFRGKVYSFDYKKDITFYSRYSKSVLVPNPLDETESFINALISFAKPHLHKPVLLITADDFLDVVSNCREKLEEYFLLNLSSKETLNKLKDKFALYNLALNNDIPVPVTYKIETEDDLKNLYNYDIKYPIFLKGTNVNTWRKHVHTSKKGFVAKNKKEAYDKLLELLAKNISIIVQEIIEGPDTNHFKVCVYYSRERNQLLNFTLRKIRQNPIHFGVGAVVESIKYPELTALGTKFFDSINFCGIGSAEFKLDDSDGKLKLIEINPRYWQQNYLSTVCGMNFPLVDYLEVTDQNHEVTFDFTSGIKWVNRYMDLDSFLDYKKEGTLNFCDWRKSLKGKKVYSDFIWSDPIPALFEIGFGKKIFKLRNYFKKRK